MTQLSSILDTASATGIFHRTSTTDELPFQTTQKKHDNESHIFEPTINSTSPYAYVFLLAGCNTDGHSFVVFGILVHGHGVCRDFERTLSF